MRAFRLALPLAAALVYAPSVSAQAPGQIDIDWKVENRFRFFRYQDDFDRHVAKHHANNAAWRSILDVERDFMDDPGLDGFGWARTLTPREGSAMGRVCSSQALGLPPGSCRRFHSTEAKGVEENYINPVSHLVRFVAKLPADFSGATCVWTIGAKTLAPQPCATPAFERVAAKKDLSATKRVPMTTPVKLTARLAGHADRSRQIEVAVRDVLIVGMGDSLASGEGNPERPVKLSGEGFCYRRVVSGKQYFRPGRSNTGAARACPAGGAPPEGGEAANDLAKFEAARAQWLFRKCHRSVYGYQMRTALALAVKHEKIAVTYLPLGCTGATIAEGVLGPKPAREMPLRGGYMRSGIVAAQIADLRNAVLSGGKAVRPIDGVLLTIGANDLGFAELVAHTLLPESSVEHKALRFAKAALTPDEAKAKLPTLERDFVRLRAQLKPLLGGDLKKIVYAPYGNPAQQASGEACADTRKGFDVHPAFHAGGAKLSAAVAFVENQMIPNLKKFATCDGASGCSGLPQDAMRFADDHRAAFKAHGFCANGSEPAFDTNCFKADGSSFRETPDNQAMQKPLVCGYDAAAFRPYLTRARWQRTVNDSYFAAMTFPSSAPLKGKDIHDALWGLFAAVYGGAVHPTSEGHAAMADAALPHLEAAVGLK